MMIPPFNPHAETVVDVYKFEDSILFFFAGKIVANEQILVQFKFFANTFIVLNRIQACYFSSLHGVY